MNQERPGSVSPTDGDCQALSRSSLSELCEGGGPGRPPHRSRALAVLWDLAVPGLLLAADLRAPVQPLVIELADFQHAVHEAWEVLELRPLVVGGPNRYFHVDGFFDGRHEDPSTFRMISGTVWQLRCQA